MAYTPVQVCNLALAEVGDEAAQISSLPATASSDFSKEANLCAKFYDVSLKEVLRMHPWNCAKKRIKLSRLTDIPINGWSHAFAVPADCVRPLEATATNTTDRMLRYSSEWVVEGRMVLSNREDIWMLYIQGMEDLTNADPLFIKVLYTTIAAKLAYPLTQDRLLAREIQNKLESVILPDARRVNSFEGHEMPVIDSAWLEASYSGFSGTPVEAMQFEDNYGTI